MTHLCGRKNKMKQENHQPVWKVSRRHVFRFLLLVVSFLILRIMKTYGKIEDKK